MQTLWQDVRVAFRSMRKRPGFTLAILISLGLAIGVNTSTFTFLNAVLLESLPFADAERVIRVRDLRVEAGKDPIPIAVSHMNFAEWKKRNQVFTGLAAQVPQSFNLTGDGNPEHVWGALVTANFFSVLGIDPILGRDLQPGEDRLGAPAPVMLIGHGLWKRRYGGDEDAVGSEVLVDQQRYTIVGVLPPGVEFPYGAQVWVPRDFDPLAEEARERHYINVFGRLRDGVGLDRARREMEGIAEQLAREFPDSNAGWSVELKRVRDDLVGDLSSGLFPLLVAAGFVLLISCVNVANLLLVRTLQQGRDVAIQTALGAGRGRILRQVLVHSTLLALLAGAVGAALAHLTLGPLVRLSPLQEMDVYFRETIALDGTVLGFTFLVSLLVGLLFGLLPAIHASRPDLRSLMIESDRSSTGRQRWMSVFVVSEMALAVLLLAAAGLTLKSFYQQQRVDVGFNEENVLTLQIELPESKYPERRQQIAFYERLLPELDALPGVVRSGVVNAQPYSPERTLAPFVPDGYVQQHDTDYFLVNHRVASPGYLESMEIPLLQGRYLMRADVEEGRDVVVVSQRFAEAHWPGDTAVGKRVRFAREGYPWMEIVGVVSDVEEVGDEELTWYLPYTEQWRFRGMNLVLRTEADPLGLAAAVRRQIWDLDPDQTVFDVQSMRQAAAAFHRPERFSMMLFGAFGVLGLVLAGLGIYGVMAFAVSQRFREFGIRAALGAGELDLQGLVLRRALLLTALGVAVGGAGALALTRYLESVLFGVEPNDVATLLAVAVGLTLMAVVASSLPAWRAARVDPANVLRE